MAKFNHGIFSKTKGKLGGVVFQQYEGMQIGKEYQPNVKNPNTSAQYQQRAKFILSSRINMLIYPFLAPVQKANGIQYLRFQRGNSLKKIFGNTLFDTANNVATLPSMPEFRPNGQTSEPITGQLSITGNAIAFAGTAADDAPVFGTCILIAYDGSITFRTATATANSTGNYSLDFGNAPDGFQGTVHGMAYYTEETENASGVTYADIIRSTETSVATLGIELSTRANIVLSNVVSSTIWVA